MPLTLATEADAFDTLSRAKTDNEERKALWLCLAAYDVSKEYESFRSLLGLTDGAAAESFYEQIHLAYVLAWNTYGWEELQRMIRIGWNGLYLRSGT